MSPLPAIGPGPTIEMSAAVVYYACMSSSWAAAGGAQQPRLPAWNSWLERVNTEWSLLRQKTAAALEALLRAGPE